MVSLGAASLAVPEPYTVCSQDLGQHQGSLGKRRKMVRERGKEGRVGERRGRERRGERGGREREEGEMR